MNNAPEKVSIQLLKAYSYDRASADLRALVEAIFGVVDSTNYSWGDYKKDDIRIGICTHKTYMSDNVFSVSGLKLSFDDRNFKTVWRKINVKDGQLDVTKILAAFEMLKELKVEEDAAKAQAADYRKGAEESLKDLRQRVDLPGLYSQGTRYENPKPGYSLELQDLTEEQVLKIAEALGRLK